MLARTRKRAPLHTMTPNANRIIAAIAVVIQQARKKYPHVTQYDIGKSLFLADRAHLNKFGRPITFDNYVAMKDGPVPSLAYDFLKDNAEAIRRHKVTLPWKRSAAAYISPHAFSFELPADYSYFDALSPSDIEELKAGTTIVKALGFSQIRRLTHDDQAYIEAWDDEGGAGRYAMSYSLLFDIPNDDAATSLEFLSKHM
jgi:uncharacterized phage-associated protein